MTRRIDWRDGATKADRRTLKIIEENLQYHKELLNATSQDRKRLIARCYAKAARAAKRGK